MIGISEQTLKNLEWEITPPGNVRASAMMAIVETYWPDVKLEHFFPRCRYKLTAKPRPA